MTWKDILAPIKKTEQFTTLWKKVKDEYSTHTCFPPRHQIFRAIELTPFEKVKVVIIGQDPYHNDYQANGLSFSVNESVAAPPMMETAARMTMRGAAQAEASGKSGSTRAIMP